MQFKKLLSKSLLVWTCVSLLHTSLAAQSDKKAPAYEKGQILVQLAPNVTPTMLQTAVNTRISPVRAVVSSMNIWLFEFDDAATSHDEMLYTLRHQPLVKLAQNNHIIEKRTVPNDPQYGQQWQYDNTGSNSNGGVAGVDMDMDSAWSITTGGVTVLGDTIVACIIDDGFDETHQDFGTNRWYNYAEIPNNGIDDDGNGFVDDYRGWNAYNNTDDLTGGSHGTPVAGIVGAKGNNGIGVSGVNWDVKLMIVNGGGNEADALAAYAYPLAMRRLYNQTNRQRGAYVVTTNASWGVNNLHAADAPLWCAFYDTLGREGIINVGATSNSLVNVDLVGDMPTSCGSNYLITVTNMRSDGTREPASGYGATTIDLGSFGTGVWTTAANNSYAGFGGTSGATPHVTGVAALLYAAPCPRLAVLAQTDPAATALNIKDFILNGVTPNTNLQNITTTGGVINAHRALQLAMQSGCAMSGCYETYSLRASNVSGNAMTVSWAAVPDAVRYNVRYRMQGDTMWAMQTVQDSFIQLANLQACTNYEFEIVSDCDTATSIPSRIRVFKTGDCCAAPTHITQISTSETTAAFNWNTDTFVQHYTIEYKDINNATSSYITTTVPNITFNNLTNCTLYEMRVWSHCAINVNNDTTSWTDFRTRGCGTCIDSTYCTLRAGDASYEWIERVEIGTINNITASNGGYADFTLGNQTTVLRVGDSIRVSLALAQNNSATPWRWRIWIDTDQNGDFDETNELVFDSNPRTTQTIIDTFSLPINAREGLTRMRVSMKWGSSAAPACGTYTYGEVEDYCVTIDNPIAVERLNSGAFFAAYPNPFGNQIWVNLHAKAATDGILHLYNATGQLLQTQNLAVQSGDNQFTLTTDDLPRGVYMLTIRLADGKQWTQKLVK